MMAKNLRPDNLRVVKGSDSETSRCPICFNTFLTSNIQSHASTCNGKVDGLEDSEKDNESKRNSQNENKTAETNQISSFFKSPCHKRSQSITESTKNENSFKKPKYEEESGSSSESCFKKDNSVRRPLADLMRPKELKQYKGQEDVVGDKHGAIWLPIIQSISRPGAVAAVPSMIIWGPPGCGKTSLANVLSSEASKAQNRKWRFTRLSACNSGVAQVKEEVSKAKNERSLFKRSTMLFIDEIHRFNKTQQDALLPHVEDGTVTLIGATTENPSFSINSALLSRCRVIVLKKLVPAVIFDILHSALEKLNIEIIKKDEEVESKDAHILIEEEAVIYLSNVSDGDARIALNCLEISHQISKSGEVIENVQDPNKNDGNKKIITIEDLKSSLKRSHMLYDKKGDEHYHCASALQKSIRGSDDSAALYWLMRMFEGGEDPLYIARRLVRIASEDVGLGDSKALGVAVAAMQGCQLIGRPECDVILAQCTTYLARAHKSHEVYHAMNRVKELIKEGTVMPPVPLHLRNSTSSLERKLGYGSGYSSDLDNVKKITYMPEQLKDEQFF